MIINYKVRNYKTFYDEINVSFKANGSIKRFSCNTIQVDDIGVLKTIGVYGPNNTGKTCLSMSLIGLKLIMLNRPHINFSNSFVKDNRVTYEVEFVIKNRFYKYEVTYDCGLNQYVKEIYSKYTTFPSNKYMKKYQPLIERDDSGRISYYQNGLKKDLGNLSSLFPSVIATSFNDKELKLAKEDYIEFANSLLLIRFDVPFDVRKTIELSQKDEYFRKFLSEFVKNADLHINEFGYSDNIKSDLDLSKSIDLNSFPVEYLKFYSNHNGFNVPSILFDSLGTQKLIALAGYIYEALKDGKILILDEINNSFHHILSRAIISLFNNVINKKAQMIFTTHDLMLMDLERLLRKDQIYLTDIDPNTNHSKITCLMEHPSYQSDGIRGDENIVNRYLKGRFKCIPNPDLYSIVEEMLNNDKTRAEKHPDNM